MTADEAIDVVIAAWVGRFRLTPAEVQILGIAAAYGTSPQEIASARSVNLTSLRKQIHKICQKSGSASLVAAAGSVLREALALVTEPGTGVRLRPR